MRTRYLHAVTATLATSALLALGAALPASADVTAATVTVTGGSLSISAPADAGNLGTRANTVAAGTISGSLGQVQVLDARSPGRFSPGGAVRRVDHEREPTVQEVDVRLELHRLLGSSAPPDTKVAI